MDKFLVRFALIACLALLAGVSCGESEKNEMPQQQESILLQQLSLYQETVASTHPVTRGWGRFLALVSSDFIGACEGAEKGAMIGGKIGTLLGGRTVEGAIIGGAVMGLVSGAGASYIADLATSSGASSCEIEAGAFIEQGRLVRGQSNEASEGEADIDYADELELPADAIAVGALHNEILDNVINAFDGDVDLATLPPGLDKDDDLPEDVSELEARIFDSPEMFTSCEDLFGRYSDSGISFTSNSLMANVANSFLTFINNYSSSLSELAGHINSYYRYISASDELSEEEKNGLYCGLAVAYYSYRYWNIDNE